MSSFIDLWIVECLKELKSVNDDIKGTIYMKKIMDLLICMEIPHEFFIETIFVSNISEKIT